MKLKLFTILMLLIISMKSDAQVATTYNHNFNLSKCFDSDGNELEKNPGYFPQINVSIISFYGSNVVYTYYNPYTDSWLEGPSLTFIKNSNGFCVYGFNGGMMGSIYMYIKPDMSTLRLQMNSRTFAEYVHD